MLRYTAPTLVSLACAASVAADVSVANFTNPFVYHYELIHMPDFDQKRDGPLSCPPPPSPEGGIEGLSNDGSMYCVPTAVANMIGYITNHGFGEITPGPGNWQSQTRYNDANAVIDCLGLLMGTNPASGTGGAGKLAGTQSWLGPSNKFIINNYWASGTYSPSQVEIALSGMFGYLVQYSYGRYTFTGDVGNIPVITRAGGHAVTCVGAQRNGFFAQLECSNPGDGDGNETVQSQFQRTIQPSAQLLVTPASDQTIVREMTWLITDLDADARLRLVDSMLTIVPKYGYSFTENAVGVLNPLIGQGPGGYSLGNPNSDGLFADAAAHPDHLGVYTLETDDLVPTRVWLLSPIGEPSTLILDAIGDAIAIEFDRHRHLLVLDENRIRSYTLGDDPLIPSAASLPHPAVAMACDDAEDEVIVISALARKMTGVPTPHHGPVGGDGDYMDDDLPPGFPAFDTCELAINPTNGNRFFVLDTSDCVHIALRDGSGGWGHDFFCDSSIVDPNGISFDDDGRMLVSLDNGSVLEFKSGTGGSDWFPVLDSIFAGMTVGRGFRVPNSRTNFMPGEHDGPKWDHVDPAELWPFDSVAVCPADFNGDGVVDVNDLLALLANWGGDDALYDIAPPGAGDGVIAVDDLLELLAAWGPCS